MSGNSRSHSVRATRRVWNVNLQKYKVNINGKMVEVRMSARAYRTLNKSVKAKAAEAAKAPIAPKAEEKAEVKALVSPAEAKTETKAEAKTEAKPAEAK
jgi:large subunit ribosomal protein L28